MKSIASQAGPKAERELAKLGDFSYEIRMAQRISVVREEADNTDGSVEPGRTVTLTGTVTALQTAHGIDRVDITEAGPGDIVSVAGLPEVTIGDTLTDGEREFAQALGSNLPQYRDVLTGLALQHKSGKKITSETFTVTPETVESRIPDTALVNTTGSPAFTIRPGAVAVETWTCSARVLQALEGNCSRGVGS